MSADGETYTISFGLEGTVGELCEDDEGSNPVLATPQGMENTNACPA